jgi:glycosyltransferase involved in cell wall biosynthesis
MKTERFVRTDRADEIAGQTRSRAKPRVAIVATHPIQHFVPFYRALSLEPDLDLCVFFGSRIGLDEYFDAEMNASFKWEMDLTSGYRHVFLPDAGRIKSSSFFQMNNASVVRALTDYAPDIIVVYGYSNIMTLGVIAASIWRKTPILLISDSELLRDRAAALGRLKRMLLPELVKRVAGILTVGDNNEAYWASFGAPAAKMFRTPFTIDEAVYRGVRAGRAARRTAWRASCGIGPEDVVFLAVGKLSERKRPGDIVAALRQARSDTPMRLVFAGDGDQRAALERQVADGGLPVNFLGFVNVDRLPDVYAAADVLVHASASDPHPLVFSESACIGLPIIASDRIGAIGPTDIARVGENTLVFPFGDVGALAEAMSSLASDPNLRGEMGQASARIFESQDLAASVSGLRAAIGSVLGEGRPGPAAST